MVRESLLYLLLVAMLTVCCFVSRNILTTFYYRHRVRSMVMAHTFGGPIWFGTWDGTSYATRGARYANTSSPQYSENTTRVSQAHATFTAIAPSSIENPVATAASIAQQADKMWFEPAAADLLSARLLNGAGSCTFDQYVASFPSGRLYPVDGSLHRAPATMGRLLNNQKVQDSDFVKGTAAHLAPGYIANRAEMFAWFRGPLRRALVASPTAQAASALSNQTSIVGSTPYDAQLKTGFTDVYNNSYIQLSARAVGATSLRYQTFMAIDCTFRTKRATQLQNGTCYTVSEWADTPAMATRARGCCDHDDTSRASTLAR